jgi:hypothetical protein
MQEPASADVVAALVSELERTYIWWRPSGDRPFSQERIVAQAMNLGTYEDIRRMEAVLGHDRLATVMRRAQPGWFSDRSWEFWRGRLSHRLGVPMPEDAPRRHFDAETI